MLRLALVLALAAAAFSLPTDLDSDSKDFSGGNQPCYDQGGFCEHDNCCAGGDYQSGLCPNYPNQVRCCFSSNTCNTGGGSCPTAAKNLACDILANYERGRIWLKPEHFNSAGNNPYDGASSLSNIQDMCYGKQAKRSAYGVAPGGYVCLTTNMLRTLHDYAEQYYRANGVAIQVNAIAGSEHSANSWHYQGNTMDVACTTPTNHCKALETYCRDAGVVEICYPGSSCGGHETWVHCAIA